MCLDPWQLGSSIYPCPLTERHCLAQNAFTATITYDLHTVPARSGAYRTFYEVITSCLASLRLRSRTDCFIRSTNAGLPSVSRPGGLNLSWLQLVHVLLLCEDLLKYAALLPVHALIARPGTVCSGCRNDEKNYLYHDELAEWEKQGAVTIRPGFPKRGLTDFEYRYRHERI